MERVTINPQAILDVLNRVCKDLDGKPCTAGDLIAHTGMTQGVQVLLAICYELSRIADALEKRAG